MERVYGIRCPWGECLGCELHTGPLWGRAGVGTEGAEGGAERREAAGGAGIAPAASCSQKEEEEEEGPVRPPFCCPLLRARGPRPPGRGLGR